jgi:hypothetical protein
MPFVVAAAVAVAGAALLPAAIGAVVVGAAVLAGGLSLLSSKSGSGSGSKPVQRLNKTINPEEPRKIIFGKTASALDLRFWEVWGPNATYYDEVIALASHRINSVQEFYLENALALDASGTAPAKYTDSYGQTQGGYNGVLSRSVNLGAYGQSALSVGSGAQWTSASKFDGVAHMCLHWVPNDKQLPNGIPSRYTQVIEGAPVYDPRRDSTVPGGSGSHRITDRTTWDYAALDSNSVPIGRNNALQVLWYLLGWYVPNAQTSEMVLTCGRGIDPSDINLASFITAANNCEAAGYYTDCILSTGDAHTDNEDKLTASGLIGTLIDPGGLWSYYANVDDSATIDAYLTDDDFTDRASTTWNDFLPMSEQFVQVAGKFNDPGPLALYQPRAYPLVRDTTYEANLGVKRRKTIDFDVVQDSLLAQKLARLALNMGQYQGELTGSVNYRVMKAQLWSVVSYTSDRFGWTKLFRVRNFTISPRDGVQVVLREINSSIWSAGSVTTPIAISAGKRFDPRQEVAVAGLTASAYTSAASDGTTLDGMLLSWTMAPANVLRTEIQYKQSTASSWETLAPINGDTNSVAVANLLSSTTYNVRARHITSFEVESAWVNLSPNFTVGNSRRVPWATVAGTTNAPASNATVGAVTGSNLTSPTYGTLTDANVYTPLGTAAAITSQGALATQNNVNLGTQVTGQLGTGNAASGLVNSNVSLSASGALLNAGGGQVTPQGLSTVGQFGGANLCQNSDFASVTGGIPDGYSIYNNGGISITSTVTVGAGAIAGAAMWRIQANAAITSSFGFFMNDLANSKPFGPYQPNTSYVFSFYAKAGNSSLVGQQLGLGYNHGPATLTFLVDPALTTSWQRYVLVFNFGSNTVDNNFPFVSIANWSGPSGSQLDFSCFQMQVGDAVTAWAPAASAFNLTYGLSGPTIYSLKPAQANADVTASNTAAAISGQGPLATVPSATPYSNASITTNADGTLNNAGGGTAPNLASISGALDLSGAKITNKDTSYLSDGAGLGTRAVWGNVSSRPANVAALTGSETINNATLQSALTGGSVVPAQSGSITGQTAWATYSGLTPSNVAGQVSGLTASGQLQPGYLGINDPTNQIGNPVFDNGSASGWLLTSGTIMGAAASGVPSSAPAAHVCYAPVQTATNSDNFWNQQIDVVPGETYYFEMWVAPSASPAPNSLIQILMHVADATNAYQTWATVAYDATYSGGWRKLSGTATIPATVDGIHVPAKLRFWQNISYHAGPQGGWYWTKAVLKRVTKTGETLVSATYGTLTDTNIYTPLGTAAAISGQGGLATKNQAAWGSDVSNIPYAVITQNFFDTADWYVGSTLSAAYLSPNVNTGTYNTVLSLQGPGGTNEPVLKMVSDANGGPQGGFDCYTFQTSKGYDPTSSYRLSIWAYQTASNGNIYLGTGANSSPIVYDMGGSGNNNPYFWVGGLPTLNKWYLIIGYVHGAGSTDGDSGLSGVYDPATGARVLAGFDFRQNASSTVLGIRSYQYYTLSAGVTAYLARPRIEKVSEALPSVAALMSSGAVLNSALQSALTGGSVIPAQSAAITGQGSLATKNNIDPSTSDVAAKGSIPPTVPDNAFSYTSTTSSISITWPAMTVYRSDGTTVSISSGSQSISGLSAGQYYGFYPFVADSGGTTGTISFANGASGSAGSPAIAYTGGSSAAGAAVMYARGNIPLYRLTTTTPSSGTGGGGGGGYACLHPSMQIGEHSAGQLRPGDLVPAPGGLVPVKTVRRKPCSEWFVINSGDIEIARVTRYHRLHLATGQEVRACEVRLGDLLATAGDHVEVTGLRLDFAEADLVEIHLDDPHLYHLGPVALLCHNPKP